MIVVVPKNTVTEEERLMLIEKGYVVLQVDNPEQVKIINPESPVESNDMIMSLLGSLSRSGSGSTSLDFVQQLYKRLKANDTFIYNDNNTNKE